MNEKERKIRIINIIAIIRQIIQSHDFDSLAPGE